MRPNFTGQWELVPNESEFGFQPQPHVRLDMLERNDHWLRISTRQKDAGGDITVVRLWDDASLAIGTTSEENRGGS